MILQPITIQVPDEIASALAQVALKNDESVEKVASLYLSRAWASEPLIRALERWAAGCNPDCSTHPECLTLLEAFKSWKESCL